MRSTKRNGVLPVETHPLSTQRDAPVELLFCNLGLGEEDFARERPAPTTAGLGRSETRASITHKEPKKWVQ